MEGLFDFVLENLPSIRGGLLGLPPSAGWAAACLWFAGELKRAGGWPTAYTRKVFHFTIFATAAAVQAAAGLPGVFVFGTGTSLVIFFATWRGSGTVLYEAMAREQDHPERTRLILVPYFATLVGGLAANFLFGEVSVVGYLVTGIGDAVGEPAGARWGRHTFRAISVTGRRSARTVEGSVAVFLGATAAAAVAAVLLGEWDGTWRTAGVVVGIGGIAVAGEALSPRGADNLVLQLVPTAVATLWW